VLVRSKSCVAGAPDSQESSSLISRPFSAVSGLAAVLSSNDRDIASVMSFMCLRVGGRRFD